MTATTTRPAAGAPTQRSRYSLEALQQSRRAKATSGVVLVAAVVAIVWLIVETFTGHFTNAVHVRAELPAGSSAVTVDAPVEYLDVTVGKILSESEAPDGNVSVDMLIYPKNLVDIPAGVEAQVAPLSIFGNQYVNLVPPAQIGTAHLLAADVVKPYQGAASSSLQATVTQLYNLLNAIHPAQLDTALTAFADALAGNGQTLGQALSGGATYLGSSVVPNLSTAESDIEQLTPFADTVEGNSGDLLGTLSNSAVTGDTITTQEGDLKTLLSSGTGAVGQFAGVLQQVQVQLPELLNESGPLLADVTQSPTELSQTLSGLTTFASAVAAQEEAGPFLSVDVQLPVANMSAGVNAALGYDNPTSVDEALGSAVNPPTYTSANCPEYPGESNPYCGTGGSPDAAASASSSQVGAVTPLAAPVPSSGPAATSDRPDVTQQLFTASSADPTTAEEQSALEVATALNGDRSPAAPGVATLILLPLLDAMTGS